ncbi:hypothetical protein AK812_SmicGene2588 [Symbiodinium microadriaticum]|uniref:Uncharacterized protein n=1 Tax=Symbiodinium microadriaticum TaxID=2951 RepID=A0A1Q9F125_SYMMI|nr:hypothetical protein AK812_SmicGene2588 [Symbiodinium microadriaticum]
MFNTCALGLLLLSLPTEEELYKFFLHLEVCFCDSFGATPQKQWQLRDLLLPSGKLKARVRAMPTSRHDICTSDRMDKYSQKADYSDQFALRRYAAPVASWIAYGPKGRAPQVKELKLLKKFMDKMDGEPLPSRLAHVLADMRAVLQCLPARPADGSWNEAEKELQKSFRKLRRRCNESVAETAMVGTDGGSAEAELKAEQEEVVQACEAHDLTSPGTSVRSDQHSTLFRKMNEWAFLDDAQKLERLQQAEEAARRPRRSLSQDHLADVVTMAAACLAAPRRQARLQDACSENVGEARAVLESPQGDNADLQRRLRSLLVHTLSLWRTYQFDCQAIEHVLDCVQQKINKFENKVGEIQGAAAGKAWLRIKQVVDELLLQVRAPPNLHVQGAIPRATKARVEAAHKFRTRQERQSGIQNICWQGQKMGWQCQIGSRQGTVRKARLFPITKFLEQGLGEEAAVEAALQEAKVYREELVREGKLKPPTPKAPSSTVRGVVFDKTYQKWRVHLYHPVDKKKVSGGFFASREEAEVKAREMARQYGVPSDFAVTPAKRSTAEEDAEASLLEMAEQVGGSQRKRFVGPWPVRYPPMEFRDPGFLQGWRTALTMNMRSEMSVLLMLQGVGISPDELFLEWAWAFEWKSCEVSPVVQQTAELKTSLIERLFIHLEPKSTQGFRAEPALPDFQSA